jgi:FkbM family methyltransferase
MTNIKGYSQYQQDLYIRETFFRDKNKGIFVDIGAHDGRTFSNTLLFEELGWDGICIEPLPHIFQKLKQNRKCKCIEGAVVDKEQEYVDFCSIDGYSEMLSGVIDFYDERHKKRIIDEGEVHKCTRTKIKVPCLNFNKVITEENIDLLSLDTEGGELNILKSIDYSKYNIKVIVVENNFAENSILNFLILKGYTYITTLGADQIFTKS